VVRAPFVNQYAAAGREPVDSLWRGRWSAQQGPAVFVKKVLVTFARCKIPQRVCFLAGSENDVGYWGPWPAGPVPSASQNSRALRNEPSLLNLHA